MSYDAIVIRCHMMPSSYDVILGDPRMQCTGVPCMLSSVAAGHTTRKAPRGFPGGGGRGGRRAAYSVRSPKTASNSSGLNGCRSQSFGRKASGRVLSRQCPANATLPSLQRALHERDAARCSAKLRLNAKLPFPARAKAPRRASAGAVFCLFGEGTARSQQRSHRSARVCATGFTVIISDACCGCTDERR